jgi:facilitated trehalose transporter
MASEQFCGGFAMLSYVSTIFTESGSRLSANMSSVIVAITQICANWISTGLVERAGRKSLMSVSLFGSGFGLLCLAVYSKIKISGIDVEHLNWIPLLSFSFVIFMQNIGILNLSFIYLAEVSPQKESIVNRWIFSIESYLKMACFDIMSSKFRHKI